MCDKHAVMIWDAINLRLMCH